MNADPQDDGGVVGTVYIVMPTSCGWIPSRADDTNATRSSRGPWMVSPGRQTGTICVRAGHHCAQVLMKRLGGSATTRASFAVHSTREDVDKLVDGLATVRRIFAQGLQRFRGARAP